MGLIGEPYRICYAAKNFTSGLTDVVLNVFKPNNISQGPYTMIEFTAPSGSGIYYFDYMDSDIIGLYTFVMNSASISAKGVKVEYFSNDITRDIKLIKSFSLFNFIKGLTSQ